MIGIVARMRSDFAEQPAGTLFTVPGIDLDIPVIRVTYLGPNGHSELLERRLIVFNYHFKDYTPLYYYYPIGETKDEVREEVMTILDLLRAGGQAVADRVKINLNRKWEKAQ